MISTNDDLLKMFFDEDFVPQAYVDILLSSFQTSQLDTLKSSCSTLLSRMDYYTGNLTRELETTIQKLQKPAELILYSSNEGQQGTTKLEYYLDTLSNSVSSLELDVHRIKTELEEMNKQYESSNAITNTLAKLTVAKTHLLSVKKYFDSLKSIAVISIQDDVEKLQRISLTDFQLALSTLEETIIMALNQPGADCTELMQKIDAFTELKHVLKGLNKFYVPYSEFSQAIQKEKDKYLNDKNLIDEL